jgi:hypothetical protein
VQLQQPEAGEPTHLPIPAQETLAAHVQEVHVRGDVPLAVAECC